MTFIFGSGGSSSSLEPQDQDGGQDGGPGSGEDGTWPQVEPLHKLVSTETVVSNYLVSNN